jgi:hypothetical protein
MIMMQRRLSTLSLLLLLLLLSTIITKDTNAFTSTKISQRLNVGATVKLASSLLLSASNNNDDYLTTTTQELKNTLLEHIKTLRSIKDRDGDFDINFGVKGGEINRKSRAPQKVDYYSISSDAGKAADAVITTAELLAKKYNLTANEPTLYLGDKIQGQMAPLNGEWKLLFTTAADATFSKNSTRGYATVKNVVDATRGRITNVIDFTNNDEKKPPLLKQLNVIIAATAINKNRVELRFRYAKAVLTRIFGLKCQWNLYIPVPSPFITRIIVLLSRLIKFGQGTKKTVPRAYFDVVYLDDQLRIHRTGEDNLFVQAKDTWLEARPLLA